MDNAKKKWSVTYQVKGFINSEVEADTEDEAEQIAWSEYHEGLVNDDLEWDVDELDVSEVK